ncbi:MAG: PAS domain S-box protein [Verrucomicrobiae bacterium]
MPAVQDAILMMDPDGLISYWNPAAEFIFGYRAAEAIGKNLHELLVHDPHLSVHRSAYPEFQRTGQGQAIGKTVELSAHRKDGQEIAVSLSLATVTLNGERHSVGIVRDITERKKAENALLELNQHLVDAKTQAEHFAIEAEAKSEFLDIMSHELRNPLNGVLGFAEILSDTALDDEQKDYVRMISSSGEHLFAVVNDTLDFSSIEAGTMAIHAAPFDLAHLVKLSSDIVRKSAADKGLAFHCDVAAGVPA